MAFRVSGGEAGDKTKLFTDTIDRLLVVHNFGFKGLKYKEKAAGEVKF